MLTACAYEETASHKSVIIRIPLVTYTALYIQGPPPQNCAYTT